MKTQGARHAIVAVVLALAASAGVAHAQPTQIVIQDPFSANYSFVDLGTVAGLPGYAGGLTFVPNDPSTLLIGGNADSPIGGVYSFKVTRDASNHVTGFTGTPTLYSSAYGIGTGGIDGGLGFGPGGVLFYTSYPDNSLGEIKPGSTAPDRQIALTPFGLSGSVGTLAFVPAGFPGAGHFKIAQFSGLGNWYDVVLGAADANGTYPITSMTMKVALSGGPEGVVYVSAANPQFAAASVLVSEYSYGRVSAYEVDVDGDPILATRRTFLSGLTSIQGAAIDPLTGDFLFSTFGAGNHLVVVRGFGGPSTTSTTVASTSSTSSSSSSTSSSTSSTVPSTSTSTHAPTTSSTSSSSSTSSTSSSSSTSTSIAPSTTSTSTHVPTTSSTSSSSSTSSTHVPTTSSSSSSSSSTSTSSVPTSSTSSSSTSTRAPSTSSTSSSTTPRPTTTSTTLPGLDCDSVPVGPSFVSVLCRLASLVDATEAAGALGNLQAKVLAPLGRAMNQTDGARGACADNDIGDARTRLRLVLGELAQYVHRLRTGSARRKVPAAVREPLAAEGAAIAADVRALRTGLVCPSGAALVQ